MSRSPKRLYGPAALTGSAATKYTVPAGTKTIVRQIHLSNPSGSSADVTLSIGADATGTRLFDGFPIPTDSVYPYVGYWVLEAGEVIQAFGGTAIVLTIFGDELTL